LKSDRMREFKFRVWSEGRGYFIIDGMSVQDIQKDATESLELPIIIATEKCIWQQYTGLKDKNGKEIYEGDILKSIHYDGLFEVRWAKAYSGEQWCEFRIQDKEGNKVEENEPHDFYGGVYCDHKVVVGNIFEGEKV
jgi:uncharacterized phage protein (TIGR01671 family)